MTTDLLGWSFFLCSTFTEIETVITVSRETIKIPVSSVDDGTGISRCN
ncbi:hypothetical protein HMPREF0495_02248 [Levilactobacillus brevis ATCC 14869 = DSM 20054]|uniref:Uncharacterized protein n=1 Tax=Levilactobacillus brevis ATCC 14869 = DSM 20054 TaxID=649758 RepID=U2NTQ3_LEVBR|nr:hypothetical protein HMPREF0495_02248 [Levilactobacillus brevis ATCC 14869 = DSM 20054]